MSGGLDSSLMSILTKETERSQIPLFINYGQLNAEKEYTSALTHCDNHELPEPIVIDISGYGNTITSGLTDSSKDIVILMEIHQGNNIPVLSRISINEFCKDSTMNIEDICKIYNIKIEDPCAFETFINSSGETLINCVSFKNRYPDQEEEIYEFFKSKGFKLYDLNHDFKNVTNDLICPTSKITEVLVKR